MFCCRWFCTPNWQRRAEQFDFNDVVQGICRKMISRHTHIFGQDRAASSGEAPDTRENVVEKGQRHWPSPGIADVPRVLPALHRSFKVQRVRGSSRL